MNTKERKDVVKTAYDNDYRQSSANPNHQINNAGTVIKHIGTNRTMVDDKLYYGPSSAKNAINGKK